MRDDFCERNRNDVSGVILAGGKSLRMGRDKATLPFAGQPLFERVLQFMRGLFAQVLIAGDRPDLARPEVPCFPDPYPGSAMGGLYTGLLHSPTPWVMVVPCDMPHPSAELAAQLLARRGSAEAVIPRTPQGLEPLFALYHQNCLPPIREYLEKGNYRIIDFISAARVYYIDWAEEVGNINTREEYESKVREESE